MNRRHAVRIGAILALAVWLAGAVRPRPVLFEHIHDHAGDHVHAWGADDDAPSHGHPHEVHDHHHAPAHHEQAHHGHGHPGLGDDHAQSTTDTRQAPLGSNELAWGSDAGPDAHVHGQSPLPLTAATPTIRFGPGLETVAAPIVLTRVAGSLPAPALAARGPPQFLR